MNSGYWLVSTLMLPGEAFTSWFVRSAFDVGVSPLSLAGVIWPSWKALDTDLDHGFSSEKLQVLIDHSNVSLEEFDWATIKPLLPDISSGSDEHSMIPWILALGLRGRRIKSGWQFCPWCLMEDSVPYMRINWRKAWHVGCNKHNCRLLDVCPHCLTIVQPLQLGFRISDLSVCSQCNEKLTIGVKRVPIANNALALQQLADSIVGQHYVDYHGSFIPSNEWFSVLHAFEALIRKAALHKNKRLELFFKKLAIPLPNVMTFKTSLAFELMSTSERESLLSIIYQLLLVPPQRFVEVAAMLKLEKCSFWDNRMRLPKIMGQYTEQLPSTTRVYPSNRMSHRGDSKPKSKSYVLRKMARLLRRYGIRVDNDYKN